MSRRRIIWIVLVSALLLGALSPSVGLAQERPPELRSPLFRDAVPDRPEERWVGERVSMSLRDADLVEVLRSFARLGDLNMILHPGIKGSVTVELKEVPWDQAMSMILKMNGLGMDITHGTLRIAPPRALRKMIETESKLPSEPIIPVYRIRGELRHLDAVAVARLLRRPEEGYLTPRGRAQADPRTRTLSLEDLRRRLEQVSKMVAALDVPAAETWSDQELASQAEAWWRRHVGTGGF